MLSDRTWAKAKHLKVYVGRIFSKNGYMLMYVLSDNLSNQSMLVSIRYLMLCKRGETAEPCLIEKLLGSLLPLHYYTDSQIFFPFFVHWEKAETCHPSLFISVNKINKNNKPPLLLSVTVFLTMSAVRKATKSLLEKF